GPVSFMRGYDAFAGVIKSGGKTRRAAKMVILNAEHPDIMEFINSKAHEEKKAWSLIEAGYDGSFDGEAYRSVFFQNSNNTVRVPNSFMRAVVQNRKWKTRSVKENKPMDVYQARDILKKVAEAAYICGDPGIQFDTTINDWHTCKTNSRINASNPCSEYMFVDNSACNLSSLNLLKFMDDEGHFDVKKFCHTINLMITAMDLIVDNASYPTPAIEKNSHEYRPLGLGYANLGAVLMYLGLPYDSDEGRAFTSTITALMTGQAYKTSATLARHLGAFHHFEENKESMLTVIEMHRYHLTKIEQSFVKNEQILNAVNRIWRETFNLGNEFGFRNAQVTVIAPTGTIGFMMDCDTTGVEPDIALIKYKHLVGGGFLKIINNTVPAALKHLGHGPEEIKNILNYLNENETIEGAPHINDEYISVFDCAFKPQNGTRSIHYSGHLRMMAAVQPFISGAISKTVNLPEEITQEEIFQLLIQSWEMGLKAVAVYRNNSKRTQPLNLSRKSAEKQESAGTATMVEEFKPRRRHLPNERPSITHKFSIAGHEGYITVGMYEDYSVGEIFVRMAKEGSVVSGLVDSFATATSIMLQYGVPLDVLINKFSHTRFEPSGYTNNPKIPIAKSILDYIFRWLAIKFLEKDGKTPRHIFPIHQDELPEIDKEERPIEIKISGGKEDKIKKPEKVMAGAVVRLKGSRGESYVAQSDAPPCPDCGSITIRSGSCYKCMNCGATTGCS
ncbi:MAG: vitamin B12-dependent ribonucleotide reductase, partial [bacterium]